ncbi:MAG TPA: APC family permease, partial [Ktedonobacterales bacterium]
FLCWAVVFADIGTSVYYVPGILSHQVGLLAGLFVTLTLVVFVLLTLKYAEVSVRFPQGGGVVTVARHGINPWAGAVGGMLILVDYFLTSAISSDSGLVYLSAVFAAIAPYTLPLTLVAVALLGLLNWWGVKESAAVSALFAVAALVTDLAILVAVAITVPAHAIGQVIGEMFSVQLAPATALIGFAGSFLAFSGLESVSQLAPVMRAPRRRTVAVALGLVVITVGITSPLLTLFSTTLLTTCTPHFAVCSPDVLRASLAAHHAQPNPDQFISELAALAGGPVFGRTLEMLTAITAAALLIFACNTAIIGGYHVLLALARLGFFPKLVGWHGGGRGTPVFAIALVTVVPMVVLVAVRGDVNTLGDMYAFGLLGAFTVTCVALDALRWRERHAPAFGARAPVRRWLVFGVGILTTLLVALAWVVNLGTKPLATEFGGGVTVAGVAIAVAYYVYQRRRGRGPAFLTPIYRPIPHALLVVLAAGSPANLAVAEAACARRGAGQPLVFVYLGDLPAIPVRRHQNNDPYLFDEGARRTLSKVMHVCHKHGARPTYFAYTVAGADGLRAIRDKVRPETLLAEAGVGKSLADLLGPAREQVALVGDAADSVDVTLVYW